MADQSPRNRRQFMKGALALGAAGLTAGMAAACATTTTTASSSTPATPRQGAARMRRPLSAARLQEELIAHMQGLDVIDAHEHLSCERDRVARPVDVLTLVSLYAWFDMQSAGLPADRFPGTVGANYALDLKVPLAERWKNLSPYLHQIKYGSYYRPTAIALRDLYDVDDLNDGNYAEVSARIQANNKPGFYHQVLRERCRIKTCLVQNGRVKDQDPADLFTPVYSNFATHLFSDRSFLDTLNAQAGTNITDYDTYLAGLEKHLAEMKAQGAAGFKMTAVQQVAPDRAAARAAFTQFLADGRSADVTLASTTLDFIINKCAEWDWPVAVHCGVWNDFRLVDVKNIITLVAQHPRTRFDLYHLGLPEARETIFVAKNFPNAHLNLCWTYAVSQEITRRTINEILDTVPVNKVFGFGADYIWEIENVYGHLVMARETLAAALADRIQRGQLDLDGAKHIARLWLHDNPAGFYKLA